MQENKDYKFIDFTNSDATGVMLIRGKYKDVVYHYGQVKIAENQEDDVAKLEFSYTLVQSGEHDIDDLTNDAELHTIMGDILTNILMEQAEFETRNDNS